jgi:hypothetical protein
MHYPFSEKTIFFISGKTMFCFFKINLYLLYFDFILHFLKKSIFLVVFLFTYFYFHFLFFSLFPLKFLKFKGWP